MTAAVDEATVHPPTSAHRPRSVASAFPARSAPADWPATRLSRPEAFLRLASGPLVLTSAKSERQRMSGAGLLLDWLGDQPGLSWQQRWQASGSDGAGARWRRGPELWLRERGQFSQAAHSGLCGAASLAMCADLVRPSVRWLSGTVLQGGVLVGRMSRARDIEGFIRLREMCDRDETVTADARTHILHRGAVLIAAKGGTLAEITVGDVLELLEAEAEMRAGPPPNGSAFYRLLRELGGFGTAAPSSLRELQTRGQRTPEELIEVFGLACAPVRDLLVDYLKERQPASDLRK